MADSVTGADSWLDFALRGRGIHGMANADPLLTRMRGGLIVSCQPEAEARESDPMNSPVIMAALARAAVLGGAVAIRADSPADIAAIRAAVAVPLIGILKRDVPGFAVRITPTLADAERVAAAGAEVIALDATERTRPEGRTAAELIRAVKEATGKPVFADVATLEEGVRAAKAGADAVLPTLAGPAGGDAGADEPDFELLAALIREVDVPVIAEGRIATPAQAARALELGAWAVCVGSAITRPRRITAAFAAALRAS
ncbi:MAG: N-acetylmannosamine-6-phosphate 2-epimerase [Opitutaceae bacterium]